MRQYPCPLVDGKPPPFKPRNVIVVGTRTFHDKKLFLKEVDRFVFLLPWVKVFTGDGWQKGYGPWNKNWVGADCFAVRWAMARWFPYRVLEADWYGHGRAAGPIRNRAILDEAGEKARLIAFHDGHSPGTYDMITQAKKRLRKTRIRIVRY